MSNTFKYNLIITLISIEPENQQYSYVLSKFFPIQKYWHSIEKRVFIYKNELHFSPTSNIEIQIIWGTDFMILTIFGNIFPFNSTKV